MNFTENRIIKKILAVLIIIMMTMADLSIIGSTVISYALDMVSTNNNNVEFFAYFINENEQKITDIECTTYQKDIKMYVEVSVKNEGYFNGKITLEDSSFYINDDVSSEYVKEIKDNIITLNQINAGTVAKIELKINYNNSEIIEISSLNQENKINLTGEYVNSKRNVEIKGSTIVNINWKSPTDIGAKTDTKVITNSIYKINDLNKKVVQVLIESKLENNAYPVKETNIEINVPVGAEEVTVHSRSTQATNGMKEKYEYNYDLNTVEPKLIISLKNEDQNGNVSWKKDAKDSIIVTYVYPESKDLKYEKINSNVTITTYDGKVLKGESNAIISEELEGIITTQILEQEKEIYKGKIYTAEKRYYTSTTKLDVDYSNVIDGLDLIEESVFKTKTEEKNANIQYVETKISKAEFDKMFGEDGYINILDGRENHLQTINKDSKIDESGNIVVKYSEGVKSLIIQTSKTISNGSLNFIHTKAILDSNLSRQEIKEIVEIEELVKTVVLKNDDDFVENKTLDKIMLKETSTKANIKVSKDKLSTITKNQNIEIVATLETNDESKDLYKDPIVKIIFPREIVEVNVTQAKALYRNGLKVSKTSQTKSDGNIILTVEFEGEQKKYDSDIINGLELHFFADIVVNKSIPSQDVSLMMRYTNKNGNEDFYNTKANVYLESQYGLMIYNKLENYNVKGEHLEVIDDNKEEVRIDVNKKGVTAKVTTAIINNYSKELQNIEIIGRIPSKRDENTFDSELYNLSIDEYNAKIYYNKDVDAKSNDNYWTKDIKDAKAYKIRIDKLEPGRALNITYDLKLEDNLLYGLNSDLSTNIICLYGDKEINKTSNIAFATEDAIIQEPTEGDKIETKSDLELNIVAVSGNRNLNKGDTIFDGETIRYTINVKNNTNKDYKDLVIKATQVNGKIFDLVETEVLNPILYGVDGKGIENYWGITNSNIKEFKSIAIKAGETAILEYQVVVNKTDGDKTYADISITSADNKLQDNIITDEYKIKEAELKLIFIPAVSEECYWTTESVQQTNLDIRNVTNEDIKNVEVKITLSKGLTCDKFKDYISWGSDSEIEIKNKEINTLGQTVLTLEIDKIASGKTAEIYLRPYILESDKQKSTVEFYARATTSSNNIYSSNNIIREVVQLKKDIEVKQTVKVNGNAINKDSIIKNEDKVDFYITVKNNDNRIAKLNIFNAIQQGLNVKKVNLKNNSEVKTDITDKFSDQNLKYDIKLSPGEEIEIVISTVVDTSYLNGKEIITNKVLVTDVETSSIFTSSVDMAVKIEKVDDGKLNIEIIQESNILNNSKVKNGDKIEFVATVKNIGDFDREVSIYNYLSSSIKDVKVLIDNKDVTGKCLIENDIKIEKHTIKANKKVTVKVTGNIDLNDYQEDMILNEFIVKSSIADIKSNTLNYYVLRDNKEDVEDKEDNEHNENIDEEKQDKEDVTVVPEVKNYVVSGKAWIDINENGKRDNNEEAIKDMEVRAINTETKQVLNVTAITNEDGSYSLELPEAKYIIIFMYNNEDYFITTYQAKKVSKDVNSDAITKTLSIDNENKTVGTTDIINLSDNKENIDIGLIFRNKFDLKLEKYVSKIVITNSEGTKTHNFEKGKLAKAEIAAKHLSGSTVVVEYKIKVTNVGDIDGYVKNIVDHMPKDMTFSSGLNREWYQLGEDLYNESIADEIIKAGESKEVTLILTKTMTDSNTGLVNNTAAIKSSYNEKSFSDTSLENNSGSADVIISVKTGAAVRLVLLTLSLTIVIAVIAYFVTKKYLVRKI